jgi:putative membrane protein
MDVIATALSIVLIGALYIAAARVHPGALHRLQVVSFSGGWLALAGALVSPLHELAEKSLSAHMLQHEILMVIAAPLLAFGRPQHVLLSLLPRRGRGVAANWIKTMAISMPVAWTLHAIAIWAWHLPVLYEAAATQPLLHAAQHASFLGTALFFWCAVLERRRDYGAAALYTFATSVHTGVLGALMFLTPLPWYRTYGIGRGAIEDQQLAGLIMWIPGGALLAFAAICLLWCWLQEIERRVVLRERLTILTNRARFLVLLILAASACAASMLSACHDAKAKAVALTGGDPDKGKEQLRSYGCWTCHTIPGVAGANAVIGPPLDGLANRAYVAGNSNSPEHLMKWIRHPQEVRNRTPMPDVGVTESDARDIAAYLYTLH